jgi:hypothetical protein
MQQPTKQKTSPTLIMLMLIIITLLGIIVYQNFSNKNVKVQPATPTPTPIQPIATSDPIVSIQTDIDKLKNEVNKIQQGKGTEWLDVLVGSAPILIWSFVIAFFVYIFLKPLTKLFDNLANRAGSSVIEINGIKIGLDDAGDAIEGQEILKIALKLSNADKGDAEDKELRFIAQQAASMNDGRENLSKENKIRVLSVAIKIALIDAEFTETEYEEILIQANRYGFNGEDIDKLNDEIVNEMLIRRHSISNDDSHIAYAAKDVIPPLQLKNRYELAKRNINAPVP